MGLSPDKARQIKAGKKAALCAVVSKTFGHHSTEWYGFLSLSEVTLLMEAGAKLQPSVEALARNGERSWGKRRNIKFEPSPQIRRLIQSSKPSPAP